MESEFELGLAEILNPETKITTSLLAAFSGPTRAESQAFAKALSTLDTERRRHVLTTMVQHAEEDFQVDYSALFVALLVDTDAQVRRLAIDGLWEYEGLDLLRRVLIMMASDKDASVRTAAVMSAGRFLYMAECETIDPRHSETIRKALLETIENPREEIEVVRRAIESIAYLNDEQVRALIDWAYVHESPTMRESAVFAMGRSADPIWAETVLAELHAESPAMRYEAARACGELQLARSVGTLVELLAIPDRELQGVIIWSLGQIGGKQAQRALERLAQSDDDYIQGAAIEAMDELDFSSRSLDLFAHDMDEEDEEDDLYDLDDEEDSDLEDVLESFDDELDSSDEDWDDDILDIG